MYERRTRARTLTRTRIELTVLKTCVAGEASIVALLFRSSILSSRSNFTSPLRVRVAITTGVVWGVLAG